MDSIYQYVAKLEQEGREFAVCTVIDAQGSSPGRTSFKMVVLPDGTQHGTVGGGKLELTVLGEAREAIAEGKSRVVTFDLSQNGRDSLGMLCGGQATLYIEYVGSRPLLYIYGAGHVGRFLATFASLVGFEVTVLDDRPEFATPRSHPRRTPLPDRRFCRTGSDDHLRSARVSCHSHGQARERRTGSASTAGAQGGQPVHRDDRFPVEDA